MKKDPFMLFRKVEYSRRVALGAENASLEPFRTRLGVEEGC